MSSGITAMKHEGGDSSWSNKQVVPNITPIMENQMEKKMEHEMETGDYIGVICVGL